MITTQLLLKSQGYEKLYPPQADSVKSGILKGQSILVSAPTASGKTLIAMLAMMGYLSKNKGKVIYLSSLRALASEKFLEFKILIDTGSTTCHTCQNLQQLEGQEMTTELRQM